MAIVNFIGYTLSVEWFEKNDTTDNKYINKWVQLFICCIHYKTNIETGSKARHKSSASSDE